MPLAGSDLLAPASSSNPLSELLSSREMDVLEAMASGATNAEIAARLYISEETVKSHVKRILRKLSATNRAQAVARFLGAPPSATALGGSSLERRESSLG